MVDLAYNINIRQSDCVNTSLRIEDRILQAIKQLGGSALMAEIYALVKDLVTTKEHLCRLLNTMYRRGVVKKEFVITGSYRGSTVGMMHKRNFVWSLVN